MPNRVLDIWYDMVMNHIDFLNYCSLRYSLRFIKENLKGDLIGTEIGVLEGNNAKLILDRISMKKLYLIDPYISSCDGSKYRSTNLKSKEIAEKKLKKYRSKINWFYDFSYNVVNLLPNDMDFVYIDGDHRYEVVKKDIEFYYPKLKKGGVLAGHDYDHYDVSKAVVEFATKNNLEVNTGGYNVEWWITKVKT